MTNLRLALAQINPVVGDFVTNTELILRAVREARDAGAGLVAVGEMALTGYPVEDLVLRESFIAASRAALAELQRRLVAEGLDDIALIVGTLEADGPVRPQAMGPRGFVGARNVGVLLRGDRVVAAHNKHHLPNHGVFDEDRHFVPGDHICVIDLHPESGAAPTPGGVAAPRRARDIRLGMVICADLWYDKGPIVSYADEDLDVLVCINASPYEHEKDKPRLAICRRVAARTGAIVAYVNLVGGQDELVFDGSSMIVHPDGRVLAHAPSYESNLLVVDLDIPTSGIAPNVTDTVLPREFPDTRLRVERSRLSLPPTRATSVEPMPPIRPELSLPQQTWETIRLGLHDYVRKNGFSSVVLGLSGGIDSAVSATIACDALGAENVHGFALPSTFSSQHSFDDAADLAARTGLNYRTIPINALVKTFHDELPLDGLAAQNLQARMRAVLLMGVSNAEGHLLLSTGNKSEIAIGYSTMYGDAAGAFAPLRDVYKTTVWELARWRNEYAVERGERPPIPENSIEKPTSAELSLDQLDTDTLPEYELLDEILRLYIDVDWGFEEITAAGYDPATVRQVLRRVNAAEYKRRQSPPGPKVSLKAFGRDRRLPITHRFAA